MIPYSVKPIVSGILNTIRSSFAAGIAIALGGSACISTEDRLAGAIFFAFGLLTILLFRLKLFTGVIGDWPQEQSDLELLIIFIGNAIGTAFAAVLLQCTPLPDHAASFIANKFPLIESIFVNPIRSVVLGFFCGIFVFLAVETWRKDSLHPVIKMVVVFLSVSSFILSGFEHCIADMFFLFLAASSHSCALGHTVVFILLVTLGNALGAITIRRLFNRNEYPTE